MLYEFAMTPDLFDNSVVNSGGNGGTILVQLLRGMAENGLLANLHRDRWLRHVTDSRITTLSPSLKDKVGACLSVMNDRHRLVRHPRWTGGDPSTDAEWLNLAFESHDRIPFHGVLLSQPLLDGCDRECSALVEFFSSLDSAQWDGRSKRTLTLNKTDSEYRAALTQVLRHAKSLALIDPWLNSQESRYMNTVIICSNVLGQRGHARLQGRIDIHAEVGKQKPDGRSIADYLSAWEQKLRPLISSDGHRFRVFLWEALPGSVSMHDRFILTDQCAISAPGGLDCRTHSNANSTDWSLLDEDARVRRWGEYDKSASTYKLVADREIL